MKSQSLFSATSLLTASLVVHGVGLFVVDRAVSLEQAQLVRTQEELLRKKQGDLQFEFVEAPAKTHPAKPKNKKKISNRDALNQDGTPHKTRSEASPSVKMLSLSDQLEQKKGSPAQEPKPKVDPVKPQRAAEPREEQSQKKKEIAMDPENIAEPLPPQRALEEQKPQTKVEPKAQVQGLPGHDKITTQEMGRAKSHGASLFGVTSFEATGSGMGEYMKNLKEKIWLAWFPYLAFKYPQDFNSADVVISMTLNSRGEIRIVKILESEGSEIFATYCLEAVQRASGFGALPKEILALIGKDELELKFGFHYR